MKAILAVAVVAGLGLAGAAASAQTVSAPIILRYADTVRTTAGTPRQGDVLLRVALYDDEHAANPLFSEGHAVTLDSSGGYAIAIGSTSPDGLPASLFLNGAATWLGITVDGDVEGGRVRLLTVPYAARAATAASLDGGGIAGLVQTIRQAIAASPAVVPAPPGAASPLNASGLSQGNGFAVANAGSCIFIEGEQVGYHGFNVAATYDGSGCFVTPRAAVHLFSSGLADGLMLSGRQKGTNQRKTSGVVGQHYDNTEEPIGIVWYDSNLTYSELNFGSGASALNAPTVISFSTAQSTTTVTGTERLRITGSGNVGIGTSTPGERLEVHGSVRLGSSTAGALVVRSLDATRAVLRPSSSSGSLLISDASEQAARGLTVADGGSVGVGTASPTAKLHVEGTARVTGALVTGSDITSGGTISGANVVAKYQDVAEWVESVDRLEPGTVVVIDPDRSNGVVRSQKAYDARVAGAVSPQPGVILGEPGPNKVMVAQSGRVRIRVDARYGSIRRGDLLVTSPRAGYAMRSTPVNVGGTTLHRPGTVLGKALEPLASGTGEVLVLLTLQ